MCAQYIPADNYRQVKVVGTGNFGVTYLCVHEPTGENVILKYIERGETIDENVEREIVNHSQLRHRNIVKFKEVLLTPTHLAIALEYAAGGELFGRIKQLGRFEEFEARYFFQQLICGVGYLHRRHICHRDLKLENTLLDDSPAPRLKICDFGYSKNALLHSNPKSTVGTPAYIAPEVFSSEEYDGEAADVWSCGVSLYVMLVGRYPFQDPKEPKNFAKTMRRIAAMDYSFPPELPLSPACRDLFAQIFVAEKERITLARIWSHPWFVQHLPVDLHVESEDVEGCAQSLEEIKRVIKEAKQVPENSPAFQKPTGAARHSDYLLDEMDEDLLDDDDSLLAGEPCFPLGGGARGAPAGGGEGLDRLLRSNSADSTGLYHSCDSCGSQELLASPSTPSKLLEQGSPFGSGDFFDALTLAKDRDRPQTEDELQSRPLGDNKSKSKRKNKNRKK